MSNRTISTLSHSDPSRRPATMMTDELVLLLECDRPLAGSTRHRLAGTDEIDIGRGDTRNTERSESRMALRVPDSHMSTIHAAIRREGLAYIVTDEKSKN